MVELKSLGNEVQVNNFVKVIDRSNAMAVILIVQFYQF